MQYTVTQLILGNRDGDALIEQIQASLKRGEEVNELELIFLPLMKSSLPVDALLRRTIELSREIPDREVSKKIAELSLIVSNRIVNDDILDELWEELRMLKVIKYAEEKGMEKGLEKGMEKGLEKGMEKGLEKGMEKGLEKGMEKGEIKIIKRLLTRKFGTLPPALSQAIDMLDSKTLESLSTEILDMKSIDELRRYIPDW